MSTALSGEVTTLAQCWKLTRRDGSVLGFTDHDRDIVIGTVTYAAGTGVQGSQTEADFGFSIGGGEIAGALAAEGLADDDLAKGLWDGASVDIFLVDWTNAANVLLLDSAVLGEIRRRGNAFTAELRGLAHRMDEERGRVYTAHCSASLGDSQCGILLSAPQWSHQGSVSYIEAQNSIHTVLSGHAEGLFTGGRLLWTSGKNAGMAIDVGRHDWSGTAMRLTLWSQPPFTVELGDAFQITAGCDKQFSTCRMRFSNALNFRGFPHMPGNDHLLKIAREGEGAMDGGSLFQ